MSKVPLKTYIRLGFYLLLPLVMLLIPLSFWESGTSLCLFKNVLGIECPGCGMTRAVVSVLHGDFIRAWQHNKLIVLVFPLVCYIYLQSLVITYRRKKYARSGTSQSARTGRN